MLSPSSRGKALVHFYLKKFNMKSTLTTAIATLAVFGSGLLGSGVAQAVTMATCNVNLGNRIGAACNSNFITAPFFSSVGWGISMSTFSAAQTTFQIRVINDQGVQYLQRDYSVAGSQIVTRSGNLTMFSRERIRVRGYAGNVGRHSALMTVVICVMSTLPQPNCAASA